MSSQGPKFVLLFYLFLTMEAQRMKLLSTALAALFALGFAGAASAQCASYSKADQTAQAPIVLPDGSAGS